MIQEKKLIENLGSLDQVNGTSVDIRLGPEIMTEDGGSAVKLYKSDSLNMLSRLLTYLPEEDYYDDFYLFPGQFILAHTLEVFNLPNNISANFHMKSSLARNGLSHMMAGHCNPGWRKSTLTLELKNDTWAHTLVLQPGMVIGQMVFYKHDDVPESKAYGVRGRYNYASSVEGSK